MIGQIASLFVRPSPRSDLETAQLPPALPAPAMVTVVCAAADAQALGAAVALAALRGGDASVALVLSWLGGPCSATGLVVPSTAAARRLAARLVARRVDARAGGRLVRSSLPADAGEAVVVARRALAASGGAVAVLVVGGPRTEVLDELLAESGLVVVAMRPGAGEEIAELAVASIPVPAAAVVGCAVELSVAGRTLATAGAGLVPSLQAALRVVAEAAR